MPSPPAAAKTASVKKTAAAKAGVTKKISPTKVTAAKKIAPAKAATPKKAVAKKSSSAKAAAPKKAVAEKSSPVTAATPKKAVAKKAVAKKSSPAKAATPKKAVAKKATPLKKASPVNAASSAPTRLVPRDPDSDPSAILSADRTRDDWHDLNHDLFIERGRKPNPTTNDPGSGLQGKIAALEAIPEAERTMADRRELRHARRFLDDVTFKIIDANYGLLRRYVRKFTQNASREDAKDFESAAIVGLMKAVDSYDPERGRFAQWAFKPIQREVLRAVHGADHQNMNPGDFERRPDVLRAVKDLQNGDESVHPPIEEVAKKAGVTLDQAKRILNAPRLDSLSTPVGDGTSTISDLIEDTEYSVENKVMASMAMRDIETYGLSQLDKRELYVIVRRMGLDREPKQRLSAIGEVLGLSREAVRQIEAKARGKLIHPVVLRKMVREGRP